jgi:hypothetical protein
MKTCAVAVGIVGSALLTSVASAQTFTNFTSWGTDFSDSRYTYRYSPGGSVDPGTFEPLSPFSSPTRYAISSDSLLKITPGVVYPGTPGTGFGQSAVIDYKFTTTDLPGGTPRNVAFTDFSFSSKDSTDSNADGVVVYFFKNNDFNNPIFAGVPFTPGFSFNMAAWTAVSGGLTHYPLGEFSPNDVLHLLISPRGTSVDDEFTMNFTLGQTVPEPLSLGLLSVAVIPLALRRRRARR